jgi:hypothetical protein
MTTIALMGAGGKVGLRIAKNLKGHPDYKPLCVEISPAGQAALADLGLAITPQDEAISQAEAVILAVPDALMSKIAADIVPKLQSGAIVIGLDPAAPYAGIMPQRPDITYFVCHPCHPPLFNDETEPAARRDWFGGEMAKQSLVCALHSGAEAHYPVGEAIARTIFAPVGRVHRVTTEQMAILEPALVETLAATCITIIREGMDEVIRMGVPEQAARDFLLGHLRIEIAVVFDEAGFPFSDGAIYAINQAKKELFQPDWKKIFALENVQKSVREITHA